MQKLTKSTTYYGRTNPKCRRATLSEKIDHPAHLMFGFWQWVKLEGYRFFYSH